MTPPLDPLHDPAFAALRDRLQAQAVPDPSPDFTQRVMAALPPTRPSRTAWSTIALRVAAALALLTSIFVFNSARKHNVASAPPDPLEILMAAQRADGGWSADPAATRPRYDTGVTALALLALVHAAPDPLAGPMAPSIRAGLDHLIRQQAPDGRFRPDHSSPPFTQYLATKAIESAALLPGADPAWKTAAGRAQTHLPPATQMAMLNRHLANPDAFPPRWVEAGGPATRAAIQMLKRP
ncbi:MAG TPA: hypothetical protein PK689_02190 [Kiritimatiellia bacterium]|nr:hypothetical protein [Kiritimatiellia bacterium]